MIPVMSPARLSSKSRLKAGMQADMKHRDERPAQFFERVARERDESLKQLAQAAE
jgi:hypothetical protein